MALAYDNATTSLGNSTSVSFSHTNTAGNVLYLFVTARFNSVVTGVTYNTVALTNLDTQNNGNIVSCSLWRLVSPATGANNVVVSASGASPAVIFAVTFSGADTGTPEGTPVKGFGTSDAPSVSVSSASGEIVVDAAALWDNGGSSTLTVGADQTERGNDIQATYVRSGCSTEPGAGSVTMSWTPDANDYWAQIAVAVKPAGPAPPSNARNMLLLGVG